MAVVVVEGPPRSWGAAQPMRGSASAAQDGDCGGGAATAAPLYSTGVAGRIRAQ